MHAEIISIGTELLMGEIVDTNSSHLASGLATLGVELRWVTKVGDDPDRLYEVLDRASRRSDVTLTSGGLGPTSDDLTRETIAKVMGEEMEVQDDLLEHLKSQFASLGRHMPATNIKQATLIPAAETIPNPLGTAPGWWVERDGKIIVAIPGPPQEMERMWTHEVAPRIRKLNPDVAIVTRTLKTFHLSEGGVDQMVAPLFSSTNPQLGIYARPDGIHLRAIATATTEEEARALLAPMVDEIRNAVGDAIWGEDDDTPAAKAGSLLLQRGLTLGTLESFTGGFLASTLTDEPDSRKFLKGSIVAQSDDVLSTHGVDRHIIDEYGPASGRVAEAMAQAACLQLHADVGIGVSELVSTPTPDSGPDGTLHIGFALDGRTSSVSERYPGRRLQIMRSYAATHALLELTRLLRE